MWPNFPHFQHFIGGLGNAGPDDWAIPSSIGPAPFASVA
jgi:hypothetical protein